MPQLNALMHSSAMTWLHAQLTAVIATIGNIAGDKQEGAMKTVIYFSVAVALLLVFIRLGGSRRRKAAKA